MNTNKSQPIRRYPNASYEILSKELLSDYDVALMSLEEEALFRRRLDEAAMSGDITFLSQFDFIGKIFKGNTKRPTIAPSIKKEVLSVGFCNYCGATNDLVVDHIFPFSKGGTNDRKNLQCLCWKCNSAKSDLTEEEYFIKAKNE